MQKNILTYLERTAPRFPDKIAFSTGKESMTFSEVQRGAAAIGSALSEEGFSSEPVVIFMDKHPRTVTAFFGVIYAGCFYVCLDEKMPESPSPRLDCGQKEFRESGGSWGGAHLSLRRDRGRGDPP